MASRFLLVGLLLATFILVALASDPGPLQDFCVADIVSKVLVNGFRLQDPKMWSIARFEYVQNPGAITIANAVFGSDPDISDDILAKAFQVDKKVIDEIQSKF
ncbi:putative germin-like protein 2-1 [Tanacetum coccineum]